MIDPKFVQFKTSDGLLLPGLFYRPKKSKSVVIHLHGNGSSSIFYSESKLQTYAEVLAKKDIAFFPFNNRGAHIIKKMNVQENGEIERKKFGMAYEKIKECIEDIDGAIAFLKEERFSTLYLEGESTGANKICVYHFYKPKNNIQKYILTAGGDDTGVYYQELGKEKFYRLLHEAKEKILSGRGEDIIQELLPDTFFSYNAFYDTANPDGDYNVFPFYEEAHAVRLTTKPRFRYFQTINKPTLVIYGEKDEYSGDTVQSTIRILKKYQPKFTYKVIKSADHSFHGHEANVANVMTQWLSTP